MKNHPLLVSVLLFCAWALLSNTRNPNNPPVSRTGAPGETTCQTTGCHSGGTFEGVVSISGVPDTVVMNQNYTVTLTNTSNAVRAGFQLTCLDSLNTYKGTLTNGTGTSIGTNNSNGRKYIRQSSPKLLNSGSASWTFTWKAPASAAGNTCKFYFVSLCANNNGEKEGDNALVSTKTVVLAQPTSSVDHIEEARSWVTVQHFSPSNTLNVRLLNANKGQIAVFDLNGRLMMESALTSDSQVSTAELTAGIYVARIRAAGRTTTYKFVR